MNLSLSQISGPNTTQISHSSKSCSFASKVNIYVYIATLEGSQNKQS